eukprot:20946-Heterococcus_DN1.PRE.4
MVSTRRQKQALSIVSNPLKIEVILHQVFSFLPGNWLYLGAVCKEWRDVYAGRAVSEVRSFHFFSSRGFNVACGPKTTLYSAAVASPLTVRMAHSCGLAMEDNYHLELRAGLHANIKTLMVLNELGMSLSCALVEAVALSGRLDVLQHLLVEEQCCSMPSRSSYYAARSGKVSMLKWLQAQGVGYSYLTCVGAANAGQLATL